MLHELLEPGVVVISIAALSISGVSMYVSRALLPAKMKRAYVRSITALAAAVETKDSGTVGHAQRVAELTVEVARKLGIQGKELERIEYAALLRDIGKADIPQAVLTKTSPLTEEEWKTVQAHTLLGADMVAAVPFLADTADYVRHHHECWDGSGYPDELKGEQIPLGSRILAATSDYDAMISERPYHAEPMTPEQAVEEILAGSGVKYDPVVVEVFLDLLVERLALRSELAQVA
jgi:putative nucleotidyltransferase with HDIG domain